MNTRFASFAAAFALAAMTAVAAHAASPSNPAQDQQENAITAQLNQQQLMNGNYGYGVETYEGVVHGPNQGIVHEQIAQPPSGDSNLSIIE